MDSTWPLVGRRRELSSIDEVLAGATGGLVLAGPPGVGKTRLLRVAMDRAAAAGRRVELLAATGAGSSIPLGAASHLLPATPSADEEPDRTTLFRWASAGWDEDGAVLAVDDAHLLDEGSAALVHHLCTHRRVVVIATVVTGASAPDAIFTLWKNGQARRMEVSPLADPLIDDLIGHALDGHVPASVRTRLRRLADGNPLHLQALVLDGLESGALVKESGTWRWQGPVVGAWRLHELVEARLRSCDSAVRSVVELVACGEPLPLELVEPEPGLLAAERAGLLEVTGDGRRSEARLAHPIYGEVLRSGLKPLRAREIHRTLAERLGATSLRRRDDLLRLTTWQLATGVRPSVPDMLAAARQSLARHDLVLAERLARAAVDAGSDQARTLLAEVLSWCGRHQDGIAVLAESGRSEPSDWTTTRARLLYWGLARHDEATTMLPDDPTVTRALILLAEGNCREALDIALKIAELESAPIDARLWAFTTAVNAYAMLGKVSTALDIARQGRRLAERHEDLVRTGLPYLRLAEGYALLFAGRLSEAQDVAEDGGQSAVQVGDPGLIAAWSALSGLISQLRGELRAAVTSLREAVAIETAQDPTGSLHLHEMILAGTLAMSGSVDEAAEVLDGAREEDSRTAVKRLFRPHAEAHRAWVSAARGDLRGAAEIALDGAALARDAGLPCMEAVVLYEAARLGAARQAEKRLKVLAETVEGDLARVYRDAAAAMAADDEAALLAAADAFADLPAPLLAAEMLTAAGRVAQEAGQTRRAGAALARARELARCCPTARTPVLDSVEGTQQLTPREREIARLAARQATSPEIARRLRLSVRTVDNHLAHVYDKLGISSRIELTSLFRGN
ncbi:LuxR C-terminal-related transcriptional regulator [Amycolatopsis alba]|uniref:Helix-turn-helix transcriptional regulator n=1 Tax=Amycolatopsis alba DSM 44262 TaxID=1125972 RepID=A0A229RI30_AMYAL|nr:LuxR family transcriptional regulator [Amycolatopsis alba]OXM46119.1 helix-turn-helix transcriptional regulator [Amycolatopsis alba DSM 44262]